MRRYRPAVTLESIRQANAQQKQRLNYWRKQLLLEEEDPQREKRLEESLCTGCFYEKSRIGGAAITFRQCAFCTEMLNSGNTNIDIMCRDCAKAAGLCRHCGCDIDMKNRRQYALPERAPDQEPY